MVCHACPLYKPVSQIVGFNSFSVSLSSHLRLCTYLYLPSRIAMRESNESCIKTFNMPPSSTYQQYCNMSYRCRLICSTRTILPSANKKTVFFPCKHFAILDTIKIFSINLDLRSVNIMNNLTFHAFVFSAEAYTPCIAIHAPL